MSPRFKLDGSEYDTLDLSEQGRELVARLSFTQSKMIEINSCIALLSKAKNGYIEDLKTEIVQERTGVDFSDLFSDE